MLRRYKEELSLKPTRDHRRHGHGFPLGRISPVTEEASSSRSVTNEELYIRIDRLRNGRPISCALPVPTGDERQTMLEVRFRLEESQPEREVVEAAAIQDLDHRATAILRRRYVERIYATPLIWTDSLQALEAGEAFNTKSGFDVGYIKDLPRLPENGRCTYGLATKGKVQGQMREDCRHIAARQLDETERLFGERRLSLEQTSLHDPRHIARHKINPGREARQPVWKAHGSESRQVIQGVTTTKKNRSFKRDEEEREEAALKAAMMYLNKGTEHVPSNTLSVWLLGNPEIQPAWNFSLTPECSHISEKATSGADSAHLSYSLNSSTNQVVGAQKMRHVHKKTVNDRDDVDVLASTHGQLWQSSMYEKAHNDGRWLSKNKSWGSDEVHSSSMLATRGRWRCRESDSNVEENLLDSKLSRVLSGLDKGVHTKSKRHWNTLTGEFPCKELWSEDTNHLQSTRIRGIQRAFEDKTVASSVKGPAKCTAVKGPRTELDDLDLSESASQICLSRLQRDDSGGFSMLQSSAQNDNNISALERSRSKLVSRRSSCGENQLAMQGEERYAHRHTQLLPLKRAQQLIYMAKGSIIGSSADFSEVLPTLNEQQEEILCESSSLRSPAWVHRLSIGKPPKWQATSITPFQLRMSAAASTGAIGIVKAAGIVEELDEVAIQHICPTEGTLVTAIKRTFEIPEARNSGGGSVSTSTMKSVDEFKQGQSSTPKYFFIPNFRTVQALQNAIASQNTSQRLQGDDGCNSYVDSALLQVLREQDRGIALQATQGEKTSILSATADSEIENVCDGSMPSRYTCDLATYDDGRLASSVDSALPQRLTVRESQYTSCSLATEHVPYLHQFRSSSIIWPKLDSLISEVIQDWMEKGVHDTKDACLQSVLNSLTSSSVSKGVYTGLQEITNYYFPYGSELASSRFLYDGLTIDGPPEIRNPEIQKNRIMENSENLERDPELKDIDGKNYVAAFASLLQPCTVLQEAETEQDVLREFEADETVRLLLEKLKFYETRLWALKRKGVEHVLKPLLVYVDKV